jgi:predicted RNA-binding Zn-ribbon protein involved in translation (DUF1610 family)
MTHADRYATKTIVVAVPCPECGGETLERTYIPTLGSMNGDVRCDKCGFEDSYVASLASAMPADPLPMGFVVRPMPSTFLLDIEESKKNRAIKITWIQRVAYRITWIQHLAHFFTMFFSAMTRVLSPERRPVVLSSRPRPLARPRAIHRRLASVVGRP